MRVDHGRPPRGDSSPSLQLRCTSTEIMWARVLTRFRDHIEDTGADKIDRHRETTPSARATEGTTMTSATDPVQDTVLPLRPPPVRQATVVRSDPAHTFEVFVATISAWWPVQPFSAGNERVREVTFEQRLGGRVYETWDDGTTVDWGTVLVWEPPHRFAMTWLVTGTATEVELTFTALGPARTRVAVEHRGWAALADAELSADCALPGGYTGGAYTRGWAEILSRFQVAVESTEPSADPSEKGENL